MTDISCAAPWNRVSLLPTQKLSPCCAYLDPVEPQSVDMRDALSDSMFEKIRLQMSSGISPAGCSTCFKREMKGISSKRTRLNEKGIPSDIDLKYLEIAVGTPCNLDCVMCSSAYSSSWVRADRKLGRKPYQQYQISDELVSTFSDIIKEKKLNVELIGGEPFFNKASHKIIDAMISSGHDHDLSVTTNCTLVDSSTIEKMEKLNTNVVASIDATGDLYEYIRGTKWGPVRDNLYALSKSSINTLMLYPTVTIYNVFSLESVFNLFLDLRSHRPAGKKMEMKINISSFPEYTSISSMAESARKKVGTGFTEVSEALRSMPYTGVTQAMNWTWKMNEMRGVKVWDIDHRLEWLRGE